MTSSITQKIWRFCDTLRDDGLAYNDYLEQLTYLLFLKMADENHSKYNLPDMCNWGSLISKKGGTLLDQYEQVLKTLAQSGGMLEKIFANSQNKINDSAKLSKLLLLINEDNWTSTEVDVKGEIYEGLLQKNAESSGAGQYFTPRAVIQTIVECISPKLGETIADPACGTGGFFLGALERLYEHEGLDERLLAFLKFKTFFGWEIERATARLCLMNLYLHGIGDMKNTPDITVSDSLKMTRPDKVDIVLANPPFGRSSSDAITNDRTLTEKDGYFLREDFWATTSNKQLNFVQHIVAMLKETGRAAVVLPDNVLFEGGAGETVRRRLMEKCDVHTILRLPTGIFYAQGVKANVVFFDNKRSSKEPWTKDIWVYDYRTNIHHTLKKNPLKASDLADFVTCYNPANRQHRTETYDAATNPEGRWRRFGYEEILARDKTSLDITWLKDKSLADLDNIPDPDVLAEEILESLEAALNNFRNIAGQLKQAE